MTTSRFCRAPFALSALLLATAFVTAAVSVAEAHDGLVPAIEQVGGAAPRPQPWQLSLGVRSALFKGAGYDPFSTNDVFAQGAVTATRAFRTGSRLATAAGVLWESGDQDATARGAASSLSLSRLGAVLEERVEPRPWLTAFARLSPSWLRGKASLIDPTIAAPLRTSFSTFGVDASVGAALLLGPRAGRVGFWLVGDAGYGWAPDQHLALRPDLPASDRDKAGVTTLSDLAPRGIFYRLAIAATF
jgi:hypothetical protein